jgi:hypothetical protein
MVGGVTCFDGLNHRAHRLSWSFPDLGFSLIRTGHKLATHEHLRDIPAVPRAALHEQVEAASFALKAADERAMVSAVHRTALILGESGLVARASHELLQKIRAVPGVLAAKGCGAMGADIVLVLHEKRDALAFKQWVTKQGLEVCGTHHELSQKGLVEMDI